MTPVHETDTEPTSRPAAVGPPAFPSDELPRFRFRSSGGGVHGVSATDAESSVSSIDAKSSVSATDAVSSVSSIDAVSSACTVDGLRTGSAVDIVWTVGTVDVGRVAPVMPPMAGNVGGEIQVGVDDAAGDVP